MSLSRIHVFDSRTAVFSDDDVLQETVIVRATRSTRQQSVTVSSSTGRDLEHGSATFAVPYSVVVSERDREKVIRVPKSTMDRELLEAIDRLPHRLRDHELEISTGPVVSFRATQHLLSDRDGDYSAPLLWPQHVQPFSTRFPYGNRKPQHIRISSETGKLLLPAKRYVLLKRFTAKEEKRRLVAGIVSPDDSYSSLIGLENHLNYISRPSGELSPVEALGLATIFNSRLIDAYFRLMSGNTQVNATEIRNLPLPELSAIIEIGKQAADDLDSTDEILASAYGVTRKLRDLFGSN